MFQYASCIPGIPPVLAEETLILEAVLRLGLIVLLLDTEAFPSAKSPGFGDGERIVTLDFHNWAAGLLCTRTLQLNYF